MARAQGKTEFRALLFLDLNDFKAINDTFGHETGDKVLCEVANRLNKIKRKSDMVFRLGGDEFTFILPGINSADDSIIFANRVPDLFKSPLLIDNNDFQMSTSIGISIYPSDGEDSGTLLKNADTAMYYVKGHGENGYKFFAEVS